mgnify:CR=1 FL=1
MVRNFTSNALKFTPPYGTVTVSVKVSHMGDDEPMGGHHDHLTDEEAMLLANLSLLDCSDAFKEYKEYGNIIVSFVDSGAGISNVCMKA